MNGNETYNDVWVLWTYIANFSERAQSLEFEDTGLDYDDDGDEVLERICAVLRDRYGAFDDEFWEKGMFHCFYLGSEPGPTYVAFAAKEVGRD